MTAKTSLADIAQILTADKRIFTEESSVYKKIPKEWLSNKVFADDILSVNPNAIHIFSKSIRSHYDFMLSLFGKTDIDFSTESQQRIDAIDESLKNNVDFVCALLERNASSYMTLYSPYVDGLINEYRKDYEFSFIEDFESIRKTDLYKKLYACGIALTKHVRRMEDVNGSNWTSGYPCIQLIPALATDKDFILEILHQNWKNYKAIPSNNYYAEFSGCDFKSPWKDPDVFDLLFVDKKMLLPHFEATKIIEDLDESLFGEKLFLKTLLERYPLPLGSLVLRAKSEEAPWINAEDINLNVLSDQGSNYFKGVLKQINKTIGTKGNIARHIDLIEFVVSKIDQNTLESAKFKSTLKANFHTIIDDDLFKRSINALNRADAVNPNKPIPKRRKTLTF